MKCRIEYGDITWGFEDFIDVNSDIFCAFKAIGIICMLSAVEEDLQARLNENTFISRLCREFFEIEVTRIIFGHCEDFVFREA